jgi:hypothetical protein
MAKKKHREQLGVALQEAVERARQFLMSKPGGAMKKKPARSAKEPSGNSQKKAMQRKTISARAKKGSAPAGKIRPVTMKISEFKKMPKGAPTESVVRWAWKPRIKTPSGEFSVDLFTEDNEPLDDQMLKLAEDLAGYAQTHSDYIREIIYGNYRFFVTEYGPDSLFCDMPANLRPEGIWNYCNPTLEVWRQPQAYHVGPPYRCNIGVYPEWEPEHGLSLEFSNGEIVTVNQAAFEIVDGILREKPGEAPVQNEPEPTAKEMALAYAKEMQAMGAELEAMISGKSPERQRWEELFPAPPTGATVETDSSIIYGDWKLDAVETAKVLTKLGEETSVAEARKEWGNYLYRISPQTLETFRGKALFDEQAFVECRRRGNRFDFVLSTDSIWEHWFDGKVLVDQCGLAYRRAAEQSPSKLVKRRKAKV